ncbi:Nucleolar protein 14 [Cynara cardunculus var. scolymus]|uniref:Nucleolar protein 14 n=1 Tax=Cynara cardunculus var. scolymus TaxID=59895 RepID=A0A103YA28_CYNCS|nr:Nucleolar protein 14 [Cynara cardunculus var. scolymus]
MWQKVQRKKTLLKDYEQSGKSSVFVDKRIGEQNEELGEFDKAILRSQREMRVKLSKKSKYNLSDGEEDEFDIEDGSLYPERDDFEDEVPFDEEEDGEVTEAEKRSVILKQLSAHGTPGAHATGIEGEENRQKTKKEVYDEIISKSKFFKVAEKAKDKEENDLLIKKLDEQFTSVQSSLAQPNQINVVKDVTSKSINHVISSKVEPDQEKADAYDKLLNEMVLDMRARPSNRTKTPEELAQDEKERLEQLEEKAGEDDGVNLEVKPRDHKQAVNTNEHVDNLDAEKKVAKVKLPGPLQGDLPYTIEAPKTMDDLSSLLENRSDSEIIEAIRRIRAFNAIKVAAENRKKIQVFYGLLLQYFSVSANKKPLNFRLLNLLVKPLMEMSIEIPYFAAICARQRLLRTRSLFAEDIKNSEKSCWPSMKTLFLLRLWSMIFPCSDFRHVVMTPAILLMCEYLTRCPIISGRDVAIGSFLCSMVCKQSRKFCPEALVFLRTLLVAALDKKSEPSQDSEDNRIQNFELESLEDENGYLVRASMLVTVVDTLQGYANIYEEFKSFPEIFLPISNLLVELTAQDHMPVALKDKLRATAQQIEKKADEHHILRRPLQMRKQKPVPIKLLNPKFEENFVSNRDYDPDRQRAEDRKLRKLVKREAKGAARELRKDNYFLAEAKARDKARLEEEKAEEYGRARAFLQEQEHAFKSGQLGKNKKRRK